MFILSKNAIWTTAVRVISVRQTSLCRNICHSSPAADGPSAVFTALHLGVEPQTNNTWPEQWTTVATLNLQNQQDSLPWTGVQTCRCVQTPVRHVSADKVRNRLPCGPRKMILITDGCPEVTEKHTVGKRPAFPDKNLTKEEWGLF